VTSARVVEVEDRSASFLQSECSNVGQYACAVTLLHRPHGAQGRELTLYEAEVPPLRSVTVFALNTFQRNAALDRRSTCLR
jgi:hypothetical protein